MHWASWHDFWHMGGAAFFVWASYAATLALLVLELIGLRVRRQRAIEGLHRWKAVRASRRHDAQRAPVPSPRATDPP